MSISRREFMIGCSTAIAAMAGGRLSGLSFAAPGDTTQRDILLFVFLRGGCDSLNLVAPVSDRDYIAKRPSLRVPDSGTDEGWPIGNPLPGVDFRWHRAAAGLRDLYDNKSLAIVHAAGLTNGTRSHFDAMDYIERGTPTSKVTASGWITRHLRSIGVGNSVDTTLPAVSASGSVPASLLGSSAAVGINGVQSFSVQASYRYNTAIQSALRKVYANGSSAMHASGIATLDTIDNLNSSVPQPEITFPQNTPGDLASALRTVANLIRMDVGLQVATVDYGGWDTHEAQSMPFANRVDGLSRALYAFYNYISAYSQRITIVVMSEFGRRLRANETGGTDHGHGGVVLVIGGSVNGGKMYGSWPGLAEEQLDNRVDLAVTTDYRVVLGELLLERLGNPSLGVVFPCMTETDYKPLNILYPSFSSLTPDFSSSGVDGTLGNGVFLPVTMR
jgi:uncharacterized protein (DUF1501 family)